MVRNLPFSTLKGLILTKIDVIKDNGGNGGGDIINFYTNDNRKFYMYHEQDCCEYVTIDDICGDLDDLLNYPILLAEEVSNTNQEECIVVDDDTEPRSTYDESWTWTFYKLSTIYGSVTIKWYGTSNGYYSESVDFYEVM